MPKDWEMNRGSRRRLRTAALLVVAGMSGVVAVVSVRNTAGMAERPPAASIPNREAAVVARSPQGRSVPDPIDDSDEGERVPTLRDRLIGTWHLARHGERTLTIRDDGTATADVRLNMVGALLYGTRIELDLTWSLEGDVMTQTIEAGRPQQAVDRLIRDWGGHRDYRVLELTPHRLILAEVGDESDRQEWSAIDSITEESPPQRSARNEKSPR